MIRATETSEPRRPAARMVAGLAAFAAILAVVVKGIVFPHGSINNDEGIYRLQAQTLQHGHLFTPALAPTAAFRPWLAALVGHHWVLKYVPVEAALLAVAGMVTGTASAALPVIAAAGVAATWLLMRELLEDTTSALVATALVALAPLMIVQSGLLVGYLPTLVLLEVFAWSVLRTVRQPRATWCVAGGVAAGVAGVARPYDTLLFALPLLVFAAVRLGRRLARPVWWYLVGALPPLAAMLVYDWAATGSALRLPFNLFEPADRPGFGLRRMYSQEQLHAFGWRLGLRGSSDHLLLTVLWVAGGPTLVLLAVIGVWRRRRSGASLALAATALTFPIGYVFFWGAWNASRLWHGVHYLGPFYFLPMVVAIAAFGGAELVSLYRRWRPLAAAVALVGVASSAVVVAPAMAADARWSRQDGAVLAAVDRV
ncbi:MAG TPA: glycosyltransferase family 39 protein, partial [Acidimicrobiales bacterium]|nr:glycosyltransferase family 39 protein [Acidimicrobiales bacterium]